MSNFYLIFNADTGKPISYQSTNKNLTEDLLREQIQINDANYDVCAIEEAEAPNAFMDNVDDVWVVKQQTPLTAAWDKETISPDGVDEMVLSPLPIPCTVFVDEVEHVVNDGSLEFRANEPGTYKFIINEIAHIQQEWLINVS